MKPDNPVNESTSSGPDAFRRSEKAEARPGAAAESGPGAAAGTETGPDADPRALARAAAGTETEPDADPRALARAAAGLRPETVLAMYEEAGAFLTGHFTLTSGFHSSGYVQSSHILGRPEYVERLAAELAARFAADDVTGVVGPTIGGTVLAYATARRLGVRAVYAERLQGILGFARGFRLGAGDRVLVVDDVVITGNSLQETIEIARLTGATVVGVGIVIDRSETPRDFGVRTERLARWHGDVHPADDCPLCRANIPLRRPKYGRL